MINKQYDKMLFDKRNELLGKTMLYERIDLSNLSDIDKNNKIIELQNKVSNLEVELFIRDEVTRQYVNKLIESKFLSITQLLENPLIKLPSGRNIEFKDLSEEELEYLESLVIKQKKLKK